MTPKQRIALVSTAAAGLVVAALVATHVTSAAQSAAGPSAAPSGRSSCQAAVSLDNLWANGFQATVTITNSGNVPLTNWYVAFMLPDASRFASGWNGLWMDSGPSLMVHAPQWSQVLAPGATAVAGFVASGADAPAFDEVNCD